MNRPQRGRLPHEIPTWVAEGSFFFITINCAWKTSVTNWKHFLATHQKIEWQRDFFDHRLRNHHEEQQKISYILMNPVRRGLCERIEDWPWIYRPNHRPPPLPA